MVIKCVVVAVELATPTADYTWCHKACEFRWRQLTPEAQRILGGHVHWDATRQSWRVPAPRPSLQRLGWKEIA